MRRLTALGALLLVGSLGVALAAPSADVGMPVPAITTMSQADAAIGRGGAGGEAGAGGRPQVLSRFASLLQSELAAIFFIVVAIALAAVSLQRNAGAAVAIFVGALVIGAFLLVPEQVESFYRSIYQFVL
jgi:hypothetical protein